MIQTLLNNGYTILDIKKMQLSDFELMVEALEQETVAEETATDAQVEELLNEVELNMSETEEVVAETNAVTNTFTDGKVSCLGPRAQYLQQHFPETIAKIRDAMNWKDDIAAIEYYGT